MEVLYIRTVIEEFREEKISVKDIIISRLIDEFLELYLKGELEESEEVECLDFINILFKAKHKFLIDFGKEKRHFRRDTQLYHLRKIKKIASMRIRREQIPSPRKKMEISSDARDFRSLINDLNKKLKREITDKTKMLLDELMKERWTVQEKTSLLKNLLRNKNVIFNDLLESHDKEEIITSFLALLDLKRKSEIVVIQKCNFGDILIKKEN